MTSPDDMVRNSKYAQFLRKGMRNAPGGLQMTHLWVQMHRDSHMYPELVATLARAREVDTPERADLEQKELEWKLNGYPPPWDVETCGCEKDRDGFLMVNVTRIAPEAPEVKRLVEKLKEAHGTVERMMRGE